MPWPPPTVATERRGICVEAITKSYRNGRVQALSGVSVKIPHGEIFGLIGPNGAGKTTFMGCLLGLLFPDSGAIWIDGSAPDVFAVRRRTGYLPERLAFDRWMTGRQFIAYHHALAGRRSAQRTEDVERALEGVEIASDAWDRPLKKYSRGMLQRVGLAQALAGVPRYLFLDEPSSGVDPAGVLILLRLLRGLRADGVTIVINSHQLDQLERLCDRVAFLRAGRIESIEDLASRSDSSRLVSVRWMGWTNSSSEAELLPAIAGKLGIRLVESAAGEARFFVGNDEEAFRLLRELLAAGAQVTEMSPGQSRLEKYFLEEGEERTHEPHDFPRNMP